jgi:hypothetical protein
MAESQVVTALVDTGIKLGRWKGSRGRLADRGWPTGAIVNRV